MLALFLLILDRNATSAQIFSTGASVKRKKHNKLAEATRTDTVQKKTNSIP